VCLLYTSGDGIDEAEDFKDDGCLGSGETSVYYLDGAQRNREEHIDGVMSSAVAWHYAGIWQTKSKGLPRYSGETHDAELYAITMAFDAAVQHSSDPSRSSENVVIFVDRRDIICMLAGEKKCIHELGTALFDGSWALADIYDGAEQLRAVGKNVVVAWVKAHYKSAGREGNNVADKAAEIALESEIVSSLSNGNSIDSANMEEK
jgi:ribonuclease HI